MRRETALLIACLLLGCPSSKAPPASTAPSEVSASPAAAPPASAAPGRSYDVSGSYDGGSECLPRGEVVELKGKLVVEPFGKGSDGARLITAEGERWILTYGARGAFLELDGQQVTARGRVCDKQEEAIRGAHFDAATLHVEADDHGVGP
jgi:hypothetical protein